MSADNISEEMDQKLDELLYRFDQYFEAQKGRGDCYNIVDEEPDWVCKRYNDIFDHAQDELKTHLCTVILELIAKAIAKYEATKSLKE